MRRELLAATALGSATFALFWSGHVGAQDVAIDWSGPYVGGAVGGGLQTGNGSLFYPETTAADGAVFFSGNTPFIVGGGLGPFTPWPTSFDFDDIQAIPSIGGGFNFQAGSLVYGIEADASLMIGEHSFSTSFSDVASNRQSAIEASIALDALLSLRPRAGIVVDRLLLFGTGGLAVGHSTFDTTASVREDFGKGADWSGSNSAWNAGFMAGGGGEFAISDRVRLKLEGLYYDLGETDVTADGVDDDGDPGVPYQGSIDLNGVIVRGGLNVHF